jgi:hypothetical protein
MQHFSIINNKHGETLAITFYMNILLKINYFSLDVYVKMFLHKKSKLEKYDSKFSKMLVYLKFDSMVLHTWSYVFFVLYNITMRFG